MEERRELRAGRFKSPALLDYFDTQEAFHELDFLSEDRELTFAAQQCMDR
jgi:hypothetical protein